jgi:oligoribonuclease NrnB/cAMP/cGMP phosphodiesterase (DHH superfamily)
MNDRVLVISHGKCVDGFVAAWAAWREYGDAAEYLFVEHEEDPADYAWPDVKGRRVYILDFAYPREMTMRLFERAKELIVLDHHDETRKVLEDLPYCRFDMERSGAGMAWDYFHGRQSRPWIIDYAEDRDLWRFKLELSREVNAYLQTQKFDFEEWNRVLDEGLAKAQELGNYMEMPRRAYVREVRTLALRQRFAGYDDIPIINVPHWSISEVVNSLAYGALFAVGWHQIASGKFKYSLRSKDDGDFNVGELAVKYGGGGHPRSAGFVSSTLVHMEER